MKSTVFSGSPNDPSVQMTLEAVERLLDIKLEVQPGQLILVGRLTKRQGCRDCSHAYNTGGNFGCDFHPHDVRPSIDPKDVNERKAAIREWLSKVYENGDDAYKAAGCPSFMAYDGIRI